MGRDKHEQFKGLRNYVSGEMRTRDRIKLTSLALNSLLFSYNEGVLRKILSCTGSLFFDCYIVLTNYSESLIMNVYVLR